MADAVPAPLLIVLSAALAWRQWGFGSGEPPHDDPTRRDRLLFQGYATLLLSGLSFVAVVFTALPALLLFTSIHMTLLGALLSLSPRPIYGMEEVTCFGVVLDAGQDQQLGGVIMLAVGAMVYLAGGILLASRLLNHESRRTAP